MSRIPPMKCKTHQVPDCPACQKLFALPCPSPGACRAHTCKGACDPWPTWVRGEHVNERKSEAAVQKPQEATRSNDPTECEDQMNKEVRKKVRRERP